MKGNLTCFTVQFEAQATTDDPNGVPQPPGAPPFASLPETGPIRLPRLSSPTVVHLMTNGDPCRILRVCVERIVECPGNCETREFKYPLCVFADNSFLLPSGLYDLTLPAQPVMGLTAGAVITGSFLLEPVTSEFVNVMLYNKPCC